MVTALRHLALLRGTALLVIIMAGLVANLAVPPASAKAASSTLSSYLANDTNNLKNPNNGSVIHNPKVFLIFEGNWAATDMQAVNQYFTDVSGSAFEGILTQYYDSSGHISNTITVSGSVMDPNFVHRDGCGTHTIVDDGPLGDISTEIGQEVASADSSTIYFVFTPPNYKFYDYNNTSCKQASCGFHSWYPGLPSLIYAVIPYGGGPCNSEFPSGADPVLIDINTASHEQFEAITDPFGGAWNSSSGEIGDKCSTRHPGISPSIAIYPLVQGEYSNASQSCEYPAMPIPICDSSSSETQSLACDVSLPNGNFNTLWLQMGGPLGPLGDPINSWYSIPGGQRQDFTSGNIFWSSSTGTYEIHGAIDSKYANMGGPSSALGFPTSNVLAISGGYVSYFYGVRCGGVATGPSNSGSAIYTSSAGTNTVQGCVYAKYQQLGGPGSALKYPVSDENTFYNSSGSRIGWGSYFAGVKCGNGGPNGSGSAIYVPSSNNSASGGHEVQGCVYVTYQRLNGPTGMLGFPVSDENTLYNSSGSVIGWVSYFAGVHCGGNYNGPYSSGSAIYVPASNNSASGGHQVQGCVYAAYQRLGGPTGILSFPVSDEITLYNSSGSRIGWVSYFAGQVCGSVGPNGSGSAIYVPSSNNSTSGGHEVQGCIYNKYWNMNGPTGALGFPLSDESGITSGCSLISAHYNTFEHGAIYYYNAKTYEVQGSIYNTYQAHGGASGVMGLPTSDEYTYDSAGDRESDFENGFIYWNKTTGQTSVVTFPPC